MIFFKKKYLLPVFNVLLLLCFVFYSTNGNAQLPMTDFDVPVVKDARTENRQRLYKSLVNGINKNLSLLISDTTEENWMDAFYSIELLRYRTPWVESKLHTAFKGIENRSSFFQYALMECIYDAWPLSFEKEVAFLLDTTADAKCFAVCAEYLLRNKPGDMAILKKIDNRKQWYPGNKVIQALWYHVIYSNQALPSVADLLNHSFYPTAKIVFSFQRKNRNYPGIAVIRDSTGNFLKDDYGNFFSVAQLARSISNLPGYLSNGNTPQGIFRMYGFDISKSTFIGPTPNIQLTMPGETSPGHFLNDSTITDSVWTIDWYRQLLPQSWKAYTPFYQTFLAGMAGRTEIIAHGTTVDPSYYKGTPYYPLTPTLGCLCTKEIWSEANGRRIQSDQEKLVEALSKAGGADGYYIVIELDDQQQPVELKDVLKYLK